jgi:hypothetical protein
MWARFADGAGLTLDAEVDGLRRLTLRMPPPSFAHGVGVYAFECRLYDDARKWKDAPVAANAARFFSPRVEEGAWVMEIDVPIRRAAFASAAMTYTGLVGQRWPFAPVDVDIVLEVIVEVHDWGDGVIGRSSPGVFNEGRAWFEERLRTPRDHERPWFESLLPVGQHHDMAHEVEWEMADRLAHVTCVKSATPRGTIKSSPGESRRSAKASKREVCKDDVVRIRTRDGYEFSVIRGDLLRCRSLAREGTVKVSATSREVLYFLRAARELAAEDIVLKCVDTIVRDRLNWRGEIMADVTWSRNDKDYWNFVTNVLGREAACGAIDMANAKGWDAAGGWMQCMTQANAQLVLFD